MIIPSRRSFSLENPNVPITAGFTIMDLFGGGKSASGSIVNQQTAMTVSAVFAAINVIAGTVGSLPFKVYRRDGRNREEARDHPLWELLQLKPNSEMMAPAFREALQGHLLTRGNAFAEIVLGKQGQVRELWPLNPDHMTIGNGIYAYDYPDGTRRTFRPGELLHIAGVGGDGRSGWSVIQYARESLGVSMAAEEYGARFYNNNARPAGILSHPEALKPEAAQRLADSWQKMNGGLASFRSRTSA